MSASRTRRLWALAPAVARSPIGAAACSSSSSSSSGPRRPRSRRRQSATVGTGASAAGKHYTIAYVPGATGVAFYDTLVAGMKTKAATLGMSVLYQGSPNFAPAAQTPIVDAVCTEHPNALVVSPTDPVAMAPAIDTCLNAGIPVITVDTGLSNTSKLTSEITHRQRLRAARSRRTTSARRSAARAQVALLSLSPTATTQVERIAVLREGDQGRLPGHHGAPRPVHRAGDQRQRDRGALHPGRAPRRQGLLRQRRAERGGRRRRAQGARPDRQGAQRGLRRQPDRGRRCSSPAGSTRPSRSPPRRRARTPPSSPTTRSPATRPASPPRSSCPTC